MTRQLLRRRRQALRRLPPAEEILRGSVLVRTVRCGKASCHCARGEGHQAGYLSVTFRGGRTEQISLPKHLLPLARRWVSNYSRWWRAVERISAINRELLRAQRLAPRTGAPGSGSPPAGATRRAHGRRGGDGSGTGTVRRRRRTS